MRDTSFRSQRRVSVATCHGTGMACMSVTHHSCQLLRVRDRFRVKVRVSVRVGTGMACMSMTQQSCQLLGLRDRFRITMV